MKLKEMVERVRQHHPEMGLTEIAHALNDAMNDIGFHAELIESADQFDTVVDQRVYQLRNHIIKIKHVDYDGVMIKKLIGRPTKRDLT